MSLRILFNDVNSKKLNNILRTSGHSDVDEDNKIDKLQFNEENDDGHSDNEIEEE